jgi:hypothetical protein
MSMLLATATLSLAAMAGASESPAATAGAPAQAAPTSMSSAEHAAAADAYDAEAKEAREKASTHALMARRYRNAAAPPKGIAVPFTPMANHCQKLADSYAAAASEATTLANLHREAGKQP